MGGSNGGFKSSQSVAAIIGEQRRVKRRDETRKSITEDKTISETTRSELLGKLTEAVSFQEADKIGKRFQKAVSGEDPEFKARQQRQAAIDITKERPGRRQTVLGKRSLI